MLIGLSQGSTDRETAARKHTTLTAAGFCRSRHVPLPFHKKEGTVKTVAGICQALHSTGNKRTTYLAAMRLV